MRVPILSAVCAALLLIALPAAAHDNDQGPPNCAPPPPPAPVAAPAPVVHIRHVARPSCMRVVRHRVVHHRAVVRKVVVVKRVVVVQQQVVEQRPCCVHEERVWRFLRGPAGGPDWDAPWPDQGAPQYANHMHQETEERSQSMHHEWSSNCGCGPRRPYATDRHGFLTWPDKTRTWHDQPAAYVGDPAQGPQDVHP